MYRNLMKHAKKRRMIPKRRTPNTLKPRKKDSGLTASIFTPSWPSFVETPRKTR